MAGFAQKTLAVFRRDRRGPHDIIRAEVTRGATLILRSEWRAPTFDTTSLRRVLEIAGNHIRANP